jgi:hypothetical protein
MAFGDKLHISQMACQQDFNHNAPVTKSLLNQKLKSLLEDLKRY